MEPGVEATALVSMTLWNPHAHSDHQEGAHAPLDQNQFQLQHNCVHKVQETPRDGGALWDTPQTAVTDGTYFSQRWGFTFGRFSVSPFGEFMVCPMCCQRSGGSLCRLHRGAPSLTGSILQRAEVKRNGEEFLKREWSSCFPLKRHRWVEWSYIIMAASLKDPHPRCTWLMFGPGTGSACVAALTITSWEARRTLTHTRSQKHTHTHTRMYSTSFTQHAICLI